MSWRDRVRTPLRGMGAYHVPPPVGIKLDANESPWPLSPIARAAIGRAVAEAELHRYPDAAATALRQLLAARLGVAAASLVLGNGSDELIAVLCAAFGEPDASGPARVLFSSPGFVMFKHETLAHGLVPVEVPFGPGFAPDLDALLAAVTRTRPSLIFLATPNNPTGTVWPRAAIERLLAHATDSVVVIDEAYVAYNDEPSCLPLVLAHEHCVVMQTLSKVGLAGLRVGYLSAQPALVAELEKVRPPYNLDMLAQAAATAVLRTAADELDAHARAVRNERDRLAAALRRIPGLELFPSGGNFILVRHARGRELDRALREAGIAVRCFDRGVATDPLAGCLRITVGTPAEDDALVERLVALTATG